MAAAITIDGLTLFGTSTVTGTGFTALREFVVQIDRPSGGTTYINVTSDGSGGFVVPFVVQTPGDVTIAVRPAVDYRGQTTAVVNETRSTGGN